MTNQIITSTTNQSVKNAKRVRDGKDRAMIFIEGSRLFEEALSSGLTFANTYVTERFYESNESSFKGGKASLPKPIMVSESVLRAMAETPSPQGVIAIANRPAFSLSDIERNLNRRGKLRVVLYLHNISNPANLGAIVRTAEAAGIAGIITSEGSADAFSPASLRGSMGSAFRLPIVEKIDMSAAFELANENQMTIASVDIKGDKSYSEADWTKPRMLVFGAEAHGLPDEILGRADEILTIEMTKPVESLNLAVSCGIILFEAKRQAGSDK